MLKCGNRHIQLTESSCEARGWLSRFVGECAICCYQCVALGESYTLLVSVRDSDNRGARSKQMNSHSLTDTQSYDTEISLTQIVLRFFTKVQLLGFILNPRSSKMSYSTQNKSVLQLGNSYESRKLITKVLWCRSGHFILWSSTSDLQAPPLTLLHLPFSPLALFTFHGV